MAYDPMRCLSESRYTELMAEIARLRDENDRIRSQYLDCAGHNARLRAALEQIADPLTVKLDTYGTGTKRALEIITALREIARKALANEQND